MDAGAAARAPFSVTVEDRPGAAAVTVTAGLPAAAGCGRTRLAAMFAGFAGTPTIRVRLDAIDGPACRLFHADHVGLRLL